MAFEGLLGNISPDDRSSLFQGLLAGAGAALASRGNTAQAIGQGLLGGLQGYAGGQQLAAQNAWRNMQAENAQTLAQQRRLEMEQIQRRNAYLTSGGAPSASQPLGGASTVANPQSTGQPRYTFAGLLQAGFTPEEAQKIVSGGGPQLNNIDAKDYTQESLSRFLETRNPADLVAVRKREVANGVAYDPYAVAPGTVFNDVNQPFLRDANGNIVPNTPYQRFQLQKASAGAPRTNVRVENKMGESLAAQIGPMLKDSLGDAEAAVQGMDAANRIMSALNSGNTFSGKLGNVGMTVAQWKDALNISGADDKAALANTRSLMQGLAQLTLQGRQQMKGQGQITENEGKLAERVSSGDFTLTPAELRTLAGAAQRTSQHLYGNYQRKFDALRGNEAYAPMAPYYQAPALPEAVSGQTPGQASGGVPADIGDLLNKYGGRGGR